MLHVPGLVLPLMACRALHQTNALFELKFFRALSNALTFTRMYKVLNMDKK
jgi:hypothetical protein